MTIKSTHEASQAPLDGEANGSIKNWVMTLVTAIFVLFYAAALLGWIRPLTDERVLARLEPIIFLIIGYYFGRLPAQQNEQTLKGELIRQKQKADAAQHAKEQAQQSREALEERLKNVRIALTALPGAGVTGGVISESRAAEPVGHSLAVARDILNS